MGACSPITLPMTVGLGGSMAAALRGCLVASHSLPHFTLGMFDQVGMCLVDN